MPRQIISGNNNIQAGRDISIEKVDVFMIKNELSAATQPIRDNLIDGTPLTENSDADNTVLIHKLKNGGFNITFRNSATRKKLDTLNIIIDYSKKQSGKAILNDIYETLLTVINMKYISQLSDGESLRSSLSDMLDELSSVSKKYEDQITIDESFLEGLLYIATSRCALKWKMEEDNENLNDC